MSARAEGSPKGRSRAIWQEADTLMRQEEAVEEAER